MMIRFLISLLIVFLINGCFLNNKPLKLGTSPWIGYETIYQAKEFGWIDENVQLVTGTLASDTFARLLRGEIDGATMTLEDVLVAKTKGIDLKVIAVLDISSGSDVILSKSKIQDLSTIKGKRIALDNAALGMLMLTKLLDKANLKQEDVIITFIPPDKQFDPWENDQIDIAITYEPFASKLRTMGAHDLMSSYDFPEMIFDVLAIRADKIQGREQTIQTIVDGHFKALEYFHLNYNDFVYRIATREKISPDEVKRTLGGVILPSQEANQGYFQPNSRLYTSLNDLNNLMSKKKFIPKKVSTENIVDATYLKEPI